MKKYIRPSILYFGLVYIGYLLTLVIPAFRTGVFAASMLVLVALEAVVNVIKSDNKSDFISLINLSVLGYLIYNLFSFIWIRMNGYPLSIFVEEFSNSILPIVFYFAAVLILFKTCNEESNDRIYRAFIIAFFVFSFVCIIMYLWAPQFYCDYLFNSGYISKADASTCRVRMEGFTGSTSISYLAVAAMLVSSKYMYKSIKNGQKTKLMTYLALFIYFLAVVFLANGRAGMVAAILVIVYLNFLVFFTFKFVDKKYLYIELAIIGILLVAMCVMTPSIATKIFARLVSLPGAIGQRSEQWVGAINNMPAHAFGQWFGNGLGANGHKAISIEGARVVADGGLVKLYCEEGAIGFAIFVYIMILTFRKGLSNLKNYFCEIGIIGTALLMSIGSNIIAFQLCMPIFWLAVGVIFSKATNDSIVEEGEQGE